MQFNIQDYLSTLENMSYIDIINNMNRNVNEIESKLYSVKWAPKLREAWWPRYISELKGYLFFLRYWEPPHGINISPLKKICENLVEKGEFKKGILDKF